jgi:hypothetical protein
VQDVYQIVAAVAGLVGILTAIRGVQNHLRSKDLIIEINEATHTWTGGTGEFEIHFKVENNQKREIPLTSVRLVRDAVDMVYTPRTLELDRTLKLPSGETKELSYYFIEPEGRSLGLLRRINLDLIIRWNGSETSKKTESRLKDSY